MKEKGGNRANLAQEGEENPFHLLFLWGAGQSSHKSPLFSILAANFLRVNDPEDGNIVRYRNDKQNANEARRRF
jgi:hypothetical protein